MSTFSTPVRDLFVTTAVASETTAATFIASASAGEVAVLKKDGSAVAAYGSDAYILWKEGNGRLRSSDTIKAGQIKSVTKSDPVTVVPAYSSFDVSVTNVAAGDVYEGLVRIQNYGSQSVYDEYPAPFFHTFVASDDVDTVTEGLIKSLSFEFSKVEGASSKYVNFKTGYVAVYTTQAAAFDASAALGANDIVWIIETNKAYFSIDGNKNGTFALTFTEKTDWSAEIAATTAEYLNGNPWFHFIKLDGATPKIYIIAKNQAMSDMKFQGYDIVFKVGIRVLDSVDFSENSVITVTNVGKVNSPGEGKNLRRLENFTKGHTGDFYRGMGYPNNFEASYNVSTDVNYYVVNVEFFETIQDVNTLSGHPSQKLLQIACANVTAANAVYAVLSALATPSLDSLFNVTATGGNNGDQLTYTAATDTWAPGASGV